jgi:hypothetical protein
MNKHGKFSSILAAVMVMILASPGGAWAGGGRYDNGGHEHGYQQKGKSGGHYNNHNKYTYNNYYGGGYYKGGNYYKGGRYYYPNYYGYNACAKNSHHNNNNSNNNDKLWIGLLGGGIVGYTLSQIPSGY